MDNMSEQTDREVVVAAFTRIDKQSISSDFLQDWEYAIQYGYTPPPTWKKALETLQRMLVVLLKYRTATCIVVFFMIGSLVLLSRTPEKRVPGVTRDEENRLAAISLDPNRPWYAPTDDLLLVNVLQFEQQWPRYAIYDPLTMEIR